MESVGKLNSIAKPMPANKRKVLFLALFVLVLLAVGGLYLFLPSGDEDSAKQQLQDLGALVAIDTDGKHISSVTLSTLKDKTNLDKAIQLVATLSRLRSLDLNRTPATDAQVEEISGLQTLGSLSLKETEISDQGLSSLAKLKSLESLHLNGTKITDEGLADLEGHDQLKILDLSDTDVTGKTVSLASIPNLNWLLLRGTKLAEGALTNLTDATKLSRLTLQEATYAQEDLDGFRKERPEVTLDL